MAVSVYPERMDQIDPEDVEASLRTLEAYIHYICERTEFALTNTFRTTTGLGSSADTVAMTLQETVNQLSAVAGQVSSLSGAVTGLQGDISRLDNTIQQAQTDIAGLDARVTALENPEPDPDPEPEQEGGN